MLATLQRPTAIPTSMSYSQLSAEFKRDFNHLVIRECKKVLAQVSVSAVQD